jgi:hypothetical protein
MEGVPTLLHSQGSGVFILYANKCVSLLQRTCFKVACAILPVMLPVPIIQRQKALGEREAQTKRPLRYSSKEIACNLDSLDCINVRCFHTWLAAVGNSVQDRHSPEITPGKIDVLVHKAPPSAAHSLMQPRRPKITSPHAAYVLCHDWTVTACSFYYMEQLSWKSVVPS